MKKNLIKLLVATSLSNFAYAETTNNLVSTDFSSGWTNTGNSYHGSSTIAGIHGGTVISDSVSLADDVGLNKNEINQGFTVNSSANVWFWNNYDQSVTMTTQAIDDNNQTITQTRTLSGTCATFNGCGYGAMTDTMVFNSNTQADYDLSLGFSFSVTDTNYQSGHWAADLKDPSMTVTYTPINLDSAVESQLVDLSKNINEDIKFENTIDFKEEVKLDTTNTFTEEPTFDEFNNNEPEVMDNGTGIVDGGFTDTASSDNKEEKTELSLETEQQDGQDSSSAITEQDMIEEKEEAPQTEVAENEENTDQGQETAEQTTDEVDKSDTASSESKENVNVSLAKTMDKIDEKVKDIDKNLQLKNLVKLRAMVDNSALEMYTKVPFYKEKKIYEDQVNITDNRVIYQKTLSSYMERDPIFTKERELYNIRLEKQKLINEIRILKNG